ncbi:hypothetical protein [Roseobacter sp.]|uniref:hypothetical protein n=1 Tax=Roseobacter sp. TaxID=1907202 RepID=UPI0032982190
MAVPKDDSPAGAAGIELVFAALDEMSNPYRVQRAMECAAKFLEYAAYEMALDQPAGDVSEIIHIAARLDQAARRIEATQMHAEPRADGADV